MLVLLLLSHKQIHIQKYSFGTYDCGYLDTLSLANDNTLYMYIFCKGLGNLRPDFGLIIMLVRN